MLLRRIISVLALGIGLSANVQAADATASASWLEQSWDTVADTYTNGKSELYLPLHTHHMRSSYSRAKIDSFNEDPLGIGYGRGKFDEKGNWRGVYIMEFQDSHYKPQWMAGYNWQAIWGDKSGWHTGLGFTAFLMARADMAKYTPFPGILPTASVGYKNFSLESTYVPGANGAGNILFLWGKWEFGK
jgi:hypothetical protein